MNRKSVYFGGDVSKGYIELHVADESGKKLHHSQLEDVPDGHAKLRALLTSYAQELAEVVFAVEATGGYERNWLATVCDVREQTAGRVKAYQLNALSVKRFLESYLHRNVTDRSSAVGICSYIRTQKLGVEYAGTAHEGIRVLYRLTQDSIRMVARLKTQLIMLLSSVAPELVKYTRDGIPDWLVALLSQYGNARDLAKALPADLKHYVRGGVDPKELIAAAKTSVASLTDVAAALAVKHLAAQLRESQKVVDERQAAVVALVQNWPDMKRVVTIKGVGPWTAAVLLLELGSFDRFKTAEAVTAFAGLDPRTEQSGDGQKRQRISRRGSARIRAALFMPALSAIRCNPVLRVFYQRLVNDNGKPAKLAVIAVMRKLLVLAWACGRQDGQAFCPTYEAKRRDKQLAAAPQAPRKPAVFDPAAPISRRALRRNGKPTLVESSTSQANGKTKGRVNATSG